MENSYLSQKEGFFTLLGILITLVIVFLLFYALLNTYFKKPAPAKKIDDSIIVPGIDTSSYQSIVNRTKNTVDALQKQREAQFDELMQKE